MSNGKELQAEWIKCGVQNIPVVNFHGFKLHDYFRNGIQVRGVMNCRLWLILQRYILYCDDETTIESDHYHTD